MSENNGKRQLQFGPKSSQKNFPQCQHCNPNPRNSSSDSGESYSDALNHVEFFKRRTNLFYDEDSEPESEGRFYSITSDTGLMCEKLFKVIIIGDPTVGKTSFVQRYVQNTFKRDYKGTVGVDFALKIIKWSDNQIIKLQLWDIAGQERFTWMTRVYYRDAQGCIIMFDLTNKNSFINSLKWKIDVDSKCRLPDGRPIPCILLANKCDLTHKQVDIMDIEVFHKEHNFIGWTETSAKEGFMVNDSMRFLMEVMMRHAETDQVITNDDTIRLTRTSERKSRCSC